MSTKLAAATNDSVKPKIKKIGPMPMTDQYLHDSAQRPDNNQQINVNQSCYKKKDKKAGCPDKCATNDPQNQHKACSKCGLCSPQCGCKKDCSKCEGNEQQCASGCENKESCANSPSCDNKQQNNINMNKQQDDMALAREEPLAASRCDLLKQPTTGTTEQLGEAGDTPVNNQQTHRKHGSARNALTRVKSQLKRLLNHKPVKIKVLEPSGEPNTNVNKAATNMHLFFNDKSDTCKVVIKRQNFPSDLKKQVENSKTDTLIDDVPSDVKDNTKNIDPEVTKSKAIEEKPSESELAKEVQSSLKKVNCLPGERSSSTEIKLHEEEIIAQSVSNISPENRRALLKQGTFIIEKPKMAWSSPVMRSKCERNASGSPVGGLQSGVNSSSPLVATGVTSLHSSSSSTFDIGSAETNHIGARSTHVTSSSGDKLLRVEKPSETYPRPQLQSYSDPVLEDVCSADGGEVGNEDIASDDGVESSGNDKDEQHKINDSLAWVIVSDDKSSSAQVEKDASASSSDIRQPVSADQHPPITNQKKSKLLKFTKTFANLPTNITGNIFNMFPSSSRSNKPKCGNSKGDKPNLVDKPTETATLPWAPEPEGDSSVVYEAVLMKHATTLTRSKKHTPDVERFSDSFQK